MTRRFIPIFFSAFIFSLSMLLFSSATFAEDSPSVSLSSIQSLADLKSILPPVEKFGAESNLNAATPITLKTRVDTGAPAFRESIPQPPRPVPSPPKINRAPRRPGLIELPPKQISTNPVIEQE